MSEYTFSCGCKFKQEDEGIKDYDGLPRISIDYYNLPLNCKKTWDLISSGRTRGVFQLESNLGRSYSKKLEPDNIAHLAALISILRPGTMNAMLDDKSMTNHYVDRKHGREPVAYIDNKLEKYLSETYGIIVYQEQAISIAKGLAGFSPEQANALRKAIGKKKADVLAKLRDIFIEGCINVSQMTRDVATELFNNIEAANRYSFNASHAYTYSFISYATAYAKAHFPLHFFTSALKFIKDNDELRDLMSEVAVFDLQVLGPSISNLLPRFNIKDGYIQYGLAEVKKSGEKEVLSFIEHVVAAEKSIDKEVKDFTWYEFLILLGDKIKRDALMNLIVCGLLDNTGVSRKTQLNDFQVYDELSDGEKRWVKENWADYRTLEDLIIKLLTSDKITKKRKIKVESLLAGLQKPGRTLQDDVEFVCDSETEAMGISVSMSRTANKERFANIKCLDFLLGSGNKNMTFVVEVKSVEERVIKTGPNEGKKMANIKLADRSGEIETTIFSKEWGEMKPDVVKGNVLLLKACRHQDASLRIESVKVI